MTSCGGGGGDDIDDEQLTSIQSMTTSLSTTSSRSSLASSLYNASELETQDGAESSADLTDTGRSFTVNSTCYGPHTDTHHIATDHTQTHITLCHHTAYTTACVCIVQV